MNTDICIGTEDIVIAKDKNGKRVYVVGKRDDWYDWRLDCEPVGRLITWHRRYSIGTPHNFDSPMDFWADLFAMLYDRGATLEDYLMNIRTLCNLMLNYSKTSIFPKEELEGKSTYHTSLDYPYYLCRVNEVGDFVAQGDWGELSTNKIDEMDADDCHEFLPLLKYLEGFEYVSMANHSPDIEFYNVYMFEHSLRKLSLEGFNDNWDSGWLGIFSCTKQEAKKACIDTSTDAWKEFFRNYAEDVITEWNDMEIGDVWGFAYTEADTIDSYRDTVERFQSGLWYSNVASAVFKNSNETCWGYHGDYEELIKEFCRDEHLEIIGILEDKE